MGQRIPTRLVGDSLANDSQRVHSNAPNHSCQTLLTRYGLVNACITRPNEPRCGSLELGALLRALKVTHDLVEVALGQLREALMDVSIEAVLLHERQHPRVVRRKAAVKLWGRLSIKHA
eukprot:gene6992-biopygen23973